ncbi:restriction endonuclease subunit S [Bacillus safensis]|uniref:restriction endonuclease subunit S n=1 Tax=Bacillus safensis TaxID=561879 RepID=UPI002FBDA4D8
MSKNVPEVRFDGFIGEWEEKFLGNEVEFYSGLTYSPEDIVTKNGTLVLRSSNVKNGEIIDADNVYVNPSKVNSQKVKQGDVIVVVRNGSRKLIGKHATVKKNLDNTVIGAFMTGIRSENSNFTNALLDTTQFAIEINKNLGATINQITTGNFKKMKFFFPSNKEQQKIGTFFKQLDDTIALQQQLVEQQQQYKKAMLQKMFPQKGERVPKVRFKGFCGDWENQKINNLVTPVVREVPKPTYSYKRLSVRSHAKGTFHQIVEDPSTIAMDKLYVIKENDLVVNITFAWEHAIAVAKKEDADLLVSHRFPTFIIDKSDINFIQQLVSKEDFRRKLDLISPGGAGRNRVLNKKDFLSLNVLVPKHIEEQQKIGTFFKQLDDTITLHEKKLEDYQQLKKALLKRMFV